MANELTPWRARAVIAVVALVGVALVTWELVAPGPPPRTASVLGGRGPIAGQLGARTFSLARDATTLGEALDLVRNGAAVALVIDWPALKAAGVTPSTLVDVRVTDVTLDHVLRTILGSADDGKAALAYDVDGRGLITVSTAAALRAAPHPPTLATDPRRFLPADVDPAVARVLSRPLLVADADRGLGRTLEIIGRAAGMPMSVDWAALGRAQISANSPTAAPVFARHDTTLAEVLAEALRAGSGGRLDYRIKDGRIEVFAKGAAR